MQMGMTPNDIEVLIHCYVSPAPHPRADAGAVAESIANFIVEGLIIEDADGSYSVTTRGKAHIKQLCSTPFPVEGWVDQNGSVIEP
jgi:hypothetical protein